MLIHINWALIMNQSMLRAGDGLFHEFWAYAIGASFIPILSVREENFINLKWLAQGHTS